jgi:hypothetical protein
VVSVGIGQRERERERETEREVLFTSKKWLKVGKHKREMSSELLDEGWMQASRWCWPDCDRYPGCRSVGDYEEYANVSLPHTAIGARALDGLPPVTPPGLNPNP